MPEYIEIIEQTRCTADFMPQDIHVHENIRSIVIKINPERGHKLITRIQEKAFVFYETYGKEPTRVIIDSQSMLDIKSYFEDITSYGMSYLNSIGHVDTDINLLGMDIIVLPQTRLHITVTDNSLSTAYRTFNRTFREAGKHPKNRSNAET